jgi:hypothetical protein
MFLPTSSQNNDRTPYQVIWPAFVFRSFGVFVSASLNTADCKRELSIAWSHTTIDCDGFCQLRHSLFWGRTAGARE